MDVNVCSRRVHDGYATIRTRGRNRPRALYRSDSEELLKDSGESPYALPQVTKDLLSNVHIRQILPRWSNTGSNKLSENYGTLRRGGKKLTEQEPMEKIVLNTFVARKKIYLEKSLNDKRENEYDECHYDSVTSDNVEDAKLMVKIDKEKASKCLSHVQTEIIESLSNLYENANEMINRKLEKRRDMAKVKKLERIASKKAIQPIYAVPNVNEKMNNRSMIINDDGNYVPSGDLYRTAARYIEDINRNIAEIDNSYEELRAKTRGAIDCSYGVVKSLPKNYQNEDNSYSGFSHRKRDALAPMPPISLNFDENIEHPLLSMTFDTTNDDNDETTKFDFRPRPNSYGKLPPKLLPRSSSMDNNTLRHSTGSTTTTTSSSKSNESLCAINENFDVFGNTREHGYRDFVTSRDVARNFRHERNEPRRAYDSWQAGKPKVQDSRVKEKERRSCHVGITKEARSLDEEFIKVQQCRNSREKTSNNRNNCLNDATYRESLNERRYETLPSRITRRALHKSSENVIEKKCLDDSCLMERSSCISNIDVRDDEKREDNGKIGLARMDDLYLMDATELIVKGETLRKIRKYWSSDEKPLAMSPSSSTLTDDVSDKSILHDDESSFENTPTSTNSRIRHNSLEFYDVETRLADAYTKTLHLTQSGSTGGFATLPRRANCTKEQRTIVDAPRRFSGNVPVLEPLYEHAVSDPVKPRANDNQVIPWWELATRKYRHRSCPALQDHVVQAFEQSLSNMNQRLKQLTATAEKKDSELQELRDTIERLRKQSAEAGLSGAGATANGRRHTLGDSDSGTTGCAGYSSSNNNNNTSSQQAPPMARQLSADSVASLNSLSSACSASSNRKKKGWLGSFSKKFSRARKNRHGSVSDAEDTKEASLTIGDLSAPNSPRLPTASKHENNHNHSNKVNGQKSPAEHENPITGSKSSSAIYKKEDDEDVDDLKEQLRQKDLVLTDITLEALKSSGELHSLKEKIAKMKNEMKNLRENNERLQRLVTSKSLTSSQSSMPTDPERRYSMTEVAYSVASMSNGDNHHNHHHHHHHHHHNNNNHHANSGDQMEDMNAATSTEENVAYATTPSAEAVIEQDTDGKRINVAVYLGSEKSFNVNLVCSSDEGPGEPPHCVIASVCISNKTSWDALDNTVRRCFKDYVTRVDPATNLGLGVDHVAAYHLGESSRFTNETQHPELLPCGYLIGHVKTIYLVLSGYSWLAIDTLIPKSIVQRLLSLLTEHRRLILCGPSGTGKNYLAGKLAHALVDADTEAGDAKDAAAVATFNVDHKSSKELRQYLAHIAERCDSNAADELPKVIILENLQHAASLGELFSGLLGTRHSTCPAIIGTMSQATCSTTNLQLHHNFRWVLCRKDMEPVKGFLGRYLRRKLLEQQLRDTITARNPEMATVVEWLPRVWLHLNKFLETHSSSDVTIGPSLFLSCPMEVAGSQVWFTDLWNYSIRPYLVEAVKEGNGEAAWEDPAQFITTTYPWIATHAVHGGRDALLRLRPEDVGYDVVNSGHNSGAGASSVKSLGSGHSDTEGDPLLNMLMRLQEAANYSSPHSNDSDSVTSMDSSHTRHSEDLSTSTSSSRGVESAL